MCGMWSTALEPRLRRRMLVRKIGLSPGMIWAGLGRRRIGPGRDGAFRLGYVRAAERRRCDVHRAGRGGGERLDRAGGVPHVRRGRRISNAARSPQKL